MEIQVSSSDSVAEKTASYLFYQLVHLLGQGPVLFFVSGGSVASSVVPILFSQLSQMPLSLRKKLTISLVDDRYGLANHPESNMLILKKNGSADLLKNSSIRYICPLDNKAQSLGEAAGMFETTLKQIISADKPALISLLGIGTDGHTAGVKPLSDAHEFNRLFCSESLVAGYRAVDFLRITVTLSLLSLCSEIALFAVGKEKRIVLNKLVTFEENGLAQFPAGIIKKISKSSIFTDQNIS